MSEPNSGVDGTVHAAEQRRRRERNRGALLLAGAVVGALAWLVGYVLVYAVVAPDVRDSQLNRIVEALNGEPATYELVGWVFYNAHFVSTVISNVPIVGGGSTSYVGGEGFSVLLYAVPVLTLAVAGLLLARYTRASSPAAGATAGLAAVTGYALPSLAGVFLFEVTLGGARGAPDALAGVALAGVMYPIVFAGAGGALGGVLGGRA